MTIAWVDEDERIWAPERKLLLARGVQVETLLDASDALLTLAGKKPTTYSVVILDVMLRQGDNRSVFSDSATRMGQETGILLARKLTELRDHSPKRLLFFSRATDPRLVAMIRATATDLSALYLQKTPKTQGKAFVRFLVEHGLV